MATPECIERVHPSSSPDPAETPVSSPPPIQSRRLTVSGGPIGPMLRLQGRWFEAAGFPIGTGINVYVTHGLLVVQAQPRKPDPPSAVVKREIPDPPSAELEGILDAFASELLDSETIAPAPHPEEPGIPVAAAG